MTTTLRMRWIAVAIAGALMLGACSSATTTPPTSAPTAGGPETQAPAGGAPTIPSGEIILQGAGATFPAPLYGTWFEAFNEKYPNIQVDYQANGSGAGIKAVTQQTVDFGASDAPMKDEEIAALPEGTKILHVPTALGAVVMIYNLPGVANLQLDAANVADIYLGKIARWNDPAIAANNPGVTLPATDILVVHRSDGSGTTNAFTTYLDTVSADWHSQVGKGKEVKWPTGIGAQGNDGVAGAVKQTEGAIGYTELNYATTAQLPSAKLKNADGNFVAGSTAGVTAAAETAAGSFPADSRQEPIINGAGADTYPIASYTYILLYQDQKDLAKAQALVAFLQWALTEGQTTEEGLGYAPLPAEIQQKALDELHTLTSGGTPVWPKGAT